MKEKFKKIKKCFEKLPIEISISDYKLIYVFIFPIFGVLHNRFRDKYLKLYYEYFNIFLYYLSYLFSFIFLIIIKFINKKKPKVTMDQNKADENDDINSDSESIDSKDIISKYNKFQKKVFIIKNTIIILFLCAASLAYNHFNYEAFIDKKTIGIAYKIPEFFLLSYLILKYKYYIHHYITLGLNTLTMISKYAINIYQSDSKDTVPYHLWFYFLFSISYVLLLVTGKFYMNKFYVSPYFIMLLIGIIMSVTLFVISLIKYWVTSESDIFTGFQNNVNSLEYFGYFVIDIITQFIYYTGLWITVYYFSPCHTIISENMIEIMYYMYDYSNNKKYWINKGFLVNFYLFPIFLIINLIFSLIFNEIIIIKWCKFDYYTKIRILERERVEQNNLHSYLNKIIEDENSQVTFSSDNNAS